MSERSKSQSYENRTFLSEITSLRFSLSFQILITITDFYFESVEFSGAEKIPLYGNASMKRSGKSYPKMMADFEITDDLTNYDVCIMYM